MFALKLQLVCISAPIAGQEVCPRILQSTSTKTLNLMHSLLWLVRHMRIDKEISAREPRTSIE